MERKVKEDDFFDRNPASWSAGEPEKGPKIEVLKSALKKCCFIWETSFSHFGKEYALKISSVFTERVNLVRPVSSKTLVLRGISRAVLTTYSRKKIWRM